MHSSANMIRKLDGTSYEDWLIAAYKNMLLELSFIFVSVNWGLGVVEVNG